MQPIGPVDSTPQIPIIASAGGTQESTAAESISATNTPTPATDNKKKEPPTALKYTVKILSGLGRGLLVTGAVVLPTITPVGGKITTEGAKTIGLLPSSTVHGKSETFSSILDSNDYTTDKFFNNFSGSGKISSVAKRLNIDLNKFDSNDDRTALSSSEEIDSLIKAFKTEQSKCDDPDLEDKIKIAIELLNDYKLINKAIWGNGDMKYLSSDECKLDPTLKAFLKPEHSTPENIQMVRGMLVVKEYNLSQNNFYIDVRFKPSFGNLLAEIKVPYNALEVKNFDPTKDNNEPLVIPISNYIFKNLSEMNEAGKNGGVPISFKEYSVVAIAGLSDDELREALNNSQKQIILTANTSVLEKIKRWSFSSDRDEIFLVKNYNKENDTVTYIGQYGNATTVPFKEFRKEMNFVVAPSDKIPNFNLFTGEILIISGLGIVFGIMPKRTIKTGTALTSRAFGWLLTKKTDETGSEKSQETPVKSDLV